MATQNIVEIVLKAVDQGLQKGLKDAGVRLDDLDKKSRGAADGAKSLTLGARALSAGLNLTTVAVAGVTAGAGLALGKFLKDSVEEFSKAELADRRFVTALEQTAGATPEAADAFRELAGELQQVTKVGDDTVLEMGALLLNMGVMPNKLEAVTRAGLDLAAGLAGKGLSVEAAMTLIGKAAGGNIEMFSRYGVNIDEAAFKARGLDAVLEQLNERFGGQAAKNAETLSAKYQGMKNALGDLGEQTGRFAAGPLALLAEGIDKSAQGWTFLLKKAGDWIGIAPIEASVTEKAAAAKVQLAEALQGAERAFGPMDAAARKFLDTIGKGLLPIEEELRQKTDEVGLAMFQLGQATEAGRKHAEAARDVAQLTIALEKQRKEMGEDSDLYEIIAERLRAAKIKEEEWGKALDASAPGLKRRAGQLVEERRQAKLTAEVREDLVGLSVSERRELDKLLAARKLGALADAKEDKQKELLAEARKRSSESIAQEAEELRRLINPAASARFESEQSERVLRNEAAARDILSGGLHENEEVLEKLTLAIRENAASLLGAEEGLEGVREDLDGMVDGTLRAAGAFKVLNPPSTFTQGWSAAFNKWSEDVENAGKTGERVFLGVQGALSAGFSDALFASARGKFEELGDVVDNFGKRVLRVLTDIAADKIANAVLKGASELAGPVLAGAGKLLGFAEGGLVEKPTLGILAEAGPELVIPLKAAGSFLQKAAADAITSAAFETAATEAATQAALQSGIELGLEEAASLAAAAAGLTTGAALFVFVDAINAGLGGQSAIRTAGDVLFGERGPGLLQKGLGALGLGAFRGRVSAEAHGAGNIAQIGLLLDDAEANFGELGVGLQQLIGASGGNPGIASNLIFQAIGDRPRLQGVDRRFGFFGLPDDGGDAGGRFVTGPSLRLVGEAGPEHVLNVDSPASVRALTEGLRPVIREILAEEGRGGGGVTVNIDARGAFLPDARSIEQLARLIEEKLRRLPRTGRGPALAGV